MKQLLVYGDSLTWGIVPGTRDRLAFDDRWPGVLENKLNLAGRHRVRVIEDCLNGRRTVWDDPFKPGRNGLHGLAQRIEINSPLALVILMLGTSNFQFCHPHSNAWSAAQGVVTLVHEIRKAPIEPGMPIPSILIVCPSPIRTPQGRISPKFCGAEQRDASLAQEYRQVATDLSCHYFDAGTVTQSSEVDGVHLDLEQHLILGTALTKVVDMMLSASTNSELPGF